MSRQFNPSALITAAAMAGAGLNAGPIPVPNGSFESPTTSFVSIPMDSWQKAPKPDWYMEGGGFSWVQLTGLFKNTAPTSPDHIDNCDGNQAVWLYVVPEVALFQDYDTLGSNESAPTHAFNASYEPGKSYHLTVGVIGTGGGMQQGATMELSLYYRDASSNMVPVAVTGITNTSDVFSNNTHLVDCRITLPTVQDGDAWAGQHIGIQMLSTVTTNLEGGYWDLDNVRLVSILEPKLSNPVATNGQFQFTLTSEPGLVIDILSTTNVALPMAAWSNSGIVTNTTGVMVFSDNASDTGLFYRAQRLTQ